MKQIHINIDLDKDDNICDIEDNIITEAAKQIIDIALKQDIDLSYKDTFEDKIYKEIKYLLSDFLNNNFKELIKKEIVSEITKKYLRTKQYKEIRDQFSIESDKTIKSGLKDVISEIVKSEIKKCFK